MLHPIPCLEAIACSVPAGLNVSVFLLIGKTSALTMNVAGVLKDWMLIGLSVLLFASPITSMQLVGYGLALVGVCWYNYSKIQAAQAAQEPKLKDAEALEAKCAPSPECQAPLHHHKGQQELLQEKLGLLPGSQAASPRIGMGRMSSSSS